MGFFSGLALDLAALDAWDDDERPWTPADPADAEDRITAPVLTGPEPDLPF